MRDIILVPGLLNTPALFAGQVNRLSQYYDFNVARHTEFSSIEEIASDILNNQDMPEEFIIGGLSMGGYITMEILRQAPHRVKGVIFMNTSARSDSDEQIERRKSFIDVSQKGVFKGITRHLLPRLIHQNSQENPLIAQVIFDMAQEVGRDAFIRQQTAIMNRIDSRESLKKIHVPVCMIVGDSDQLTPPDRAEEIVSLCPDAELHILEECGHLSALEYPEDVNDIISTFIEKCRDLL